MNLKHIVPGTYEAGEHDVVITPGVAIGLSYPGAEVEVEVVGHPEQKLLIRMCDAEYTGEFLKSFRLEPVLSRLDANGVARPMVYTDDRRQYMMDRDHSSFDFAGHEEGTRDPIFLLQKRDVLGLDLVNALNASDYYHDGETLWIDAEQFDKEEILEAVKNEDVLLKRDDDEMPFDMGIRVSNQELVDRDWALYAWETVGVFRTRKEAEDWAKSQKHNLGELDKNCRVYCIPCNGQLATIVKHIDRDELVTFIQTEAFKQALRTWRQQEAQKL